MSAKSDELSSTSTDVLALIRESREAIAQQEATYRRSIEASERKTEECIKARQEAERAAKMAETQIVEARKNKEKCERAIDLMSVLIAEVDTQNSLLQAILAGADTPIMQALREITVNISNISQAVLLLLRSGKSSGDDDSKKMQDKLINALTSAAQARINLGTNLNVERDLHAQDITGRDKNG